VLEKFRDRASELGHKKGLNLAIEIEDVPANIRKFVIQNYIRRMQMILGVYFFAERLKGKSYGCNELECKMQIWNMLTYIKSSTRRDDNRDLIYSWNLEKSLLTDEEFKNYWFWKSPKQLKQFNQKSARIHHMKDLGWAEPFAESER
jgi:hypothetical protein